MKTIRDLYREWGCDAIASVDALVTAIEAREAERDAAERERVKKFLARHATDGILLAEQLYPPPKPEKLPAGWYAVRNIEGGKAFMWEATDDFVPISCREYRPITNPFDPPPEVTGKAEPTLPTFEEWCSSQGEALCNWDQPVWTWWSDGDSMGRRLPKDVFDAIDACEESYPAFRAKNLQDNKQARDALKAALLKMGRIMG